MTVVIATIICDRKKASAGINVPSILAQDFQQPMRFYLNVEYDDIEGVHTDYRTKILEPFESAGWRFDVDWWSHTSTWWSSPKFDQDQARLHPIVIARNMALDYARAVNANGILFVDSDVILPSNALSLLESNGLPIVGGVVPGREDLAISIGYLGKARI